MVSAPDDNCDCIVDVCRIGGECCVVGLICHKYGATGGDSDSDPPDVERRRVPNGDEPIANCTAGGDIELISMADGAVVAILLTLLLLCRSVRLMLIGCERGIVFDMILCVDCKATDNWGWRESRRMLDGSGTGLGSDICKELGRGGQTTCVNDTAGGIAC